MKARTVDISAPKSLPRTGCMAEFKHAPEDFVVHEKLPFTLGRHGEHLYLEIEKVARQTQFVAQRLATFYAVRPMDVGFAGYKDARAVARQWFSVRTPSDLAPAPAQGMRVVGRGRHSCKLRRGAHGGNDFVVRLRRLRGAGWDERLARIRDQGVPNYFGAQRFAPGVLERARVWLRQAAGLRRHRHGGGRWYLSVLRSFLFNEVLGARVRAGNWDRPISGDVLDALKHVPTGPLWGRGRSASTLAAARWEERALARHAELCLGLENAGVSQARRSLVLCPRHLAWETAGDSLSLRFSLPPGGYATTVLREAFSLQVPFA